MEKRKNGERRILNRLFLFAVGRHVTHKERKRGQKSRKEAGAEKKLP